MHPSPKKPWYRILYVQVMIGVVLGIVVGSCWQAIGRAVYPTPAAGKWPEVAAVFEPLSKGFMNLVKMLIAPIIFCKIGRAQV